MREEFYSCDRRESADKLLLESRTRSNFDQTFLKSLEPRKDFILKHAKEVKELDV